MTITAPYGFVPLSEKVVTPEWLKSHDKEGKLIAPPVHDVPFEDGLCGTLELEITAETPIFIRGTENSELPFQLKDGRYAIPGTALRGALRNIVEIISFSRFSRVNDHRYAVRDLNNRHLYGQYMADIIRDTRTGRGEPMPLVNAGWLSKNGDDDEATYEIEVCDFAKVEYRPLMDLASERGVRNFRPGDKQSSVNKYETWGSTSLEVEASFTAKRPDVIGTRRLPSKFGVATPARGQAKGTLVMTGQPSRWVPDQVGRRRGAGNAKHHDFVFFPTQQKKMLVVPIQVFEDFEFAHSNRGQQNKLGRSQEPNEEWGYWENKMQNGERVPVFFLTTPDGRVSSFGLAMMYRLPYKHSIHEAINNVSRDHISPDHALDFAEGIFGTVRKTKDRKDRDGALALKGRVGISHALVTNTAIPGPVVQAILGAPKASYYPNYVEQTPGTHGGQPLRNSRGNAIYQTWMDQGGSPRGWKRYRALTQIYNPAPPTGSNGRPLDLEKVGTKFCPWPADTRFRVHIDVHNLKPQELGALLWAVDFGGDERARHALGMARPLGYGRSRIAVSKHDIQNMAGEKAVLESCRTAFKQWMAQQIPDWETSSQIRELLALAHPVATNDARYQRLDPGQRVNEFVDAKRNGLALPSAAQHGQGVARVVTTSPSGGASSVSRSGLTPGTVQAKVLEKTTKKGGAMFEIIGSKQEGILHPSSQLPPSLKPGEEYNFTIMAQGKPLALKWIDPDAPPPPPPKPSKPHRGGRPGGRPGYRR